MSSLRFSAWPHHSEEKHHMFVLCTLYSNYYFKKKQRDIKEGHSETTLSNTGLLERLNEHRLFAKDHTGCVMFDGYSYRPDNLLWLALCYLFSHIPSFWATTPAPGCDRQFSFWKSFSCLVLMLTIITYHVICIASLHYKRNIRCNTRKCSPVVVLSTATSSYKSNSQWFLFVLIFVLN